MHSKKKCILLCMGTRPEIIKMAPVYQALLHTPFEPVVLHTGQHHLGMSELYEFFGIPIHYQFDLFRRSDGLAHLTAILLESIEKTIATVKPQAVLVQGDTTSALTAALAAYYVEIPVGHVEAGLRTYRDYEPFPEEKNRELIARLANWHFAPTAQATQNLLAEGIPQSKIFQVGNTVIDAVRWSLPQLSLHTNGHFGLLPQTLHQLENRLNGGRLLLVTAHRRENWGKNIAQIAQAVRTLLEQEEDLLAVWPVHPNPKVQATVHTAFEKIRESAGHRLYLAPPVNYPCLLWLLKHSWLVLTDSGGIQEEASETKTPVLVLRDTTERMELVSSGGGKLTGTDATTIIEQVTLLGRDVEQYNRMRLGDNPFGDGFAARYIAEVLAKALSDAPAQPSVRPVEEMVL